MEHNDALVCQEQKRAPDPHTANAKSSAKRGLAQLGARRQLLLHDRREDALENGLFIDSADTAFSFIPGIKHQFSVVKSCDLYLLSERSKILQAAFNIKMIQIVDDF
jgi:hypothetical protein